MIEQRPPMISYLQVHCPISRGSVVVWNGAGSQYVMRVCTWLSCNLTCHPSHSCTAPSRRSAADNTIVVIADPRCSPVRVRAEQHISSTADHHKSLARMPFELPPLPYAMDALEPHMSKQTLEFHYGASNSKRKGCRRMQIAGVLVPTGLSGCCCWSPFARASPLDSSCNSPWPGAGYIQHRK